MKKFGAFSSSANPEELARTWKGIFGTIAVFFSTGATFLSLPFAMKLIVLSGIDVDPQSLLTTWTAIGATIAAFGTQSFAFYGIIYKIFVKINDKFLSRFTIFQ